MIRIFAMRLGAMFLLGLAGGPRAANAQTIPMVQSDGREYVGAAALAEFYQIGLKSLPGRAEFVLCHRERCALVQAVITDPGGQRLVEIAAVAKALDAEVVYEAGRKAVRFNFITTTRAKTAGLPQVGGFAPSLTLKTLDGRVVSLADYRGRRVLINSWASWCGCRNDLPAWQAFYAKERGRNFEILSVAVDVQGAKVVRPYVENAGVTFTVAVDETDALGRAFGLKLTPVSILVDELGIIRALGGGPRKDFLDRVGEVLREPVSEMSPTAPVSRPLATIPELQKRVAARPEDWRAHLELAELLVAENELETAARQIVAARSLKPEHADVCFLEGHILLRQGQREAALAQFRKARELDPENWRIRKQIWALENPDRFYSTRNPDYRWQREALEKERTQNTPATP